jgi:hypothetical protein
LVKFSWVENCDVMIMAGGSQVFEIYRE